MNLNDLAGTLVGAVNPDLPATLFSSTGSTIGSNFKQVPSYSKTAVRAQVQPLTSKDLRLLDSMNIQGAEKAIYMSATALGVIRIKNRGGDLVVFAPGTLPEGDTWLVLASLEQWPDWCKVACVLQDDIPDPS